MQENEIKIPRALSYEDINRATFKTIELSEEWQKHLGVPQLGNSHWLIYGGSGQGKTSYALQVVNEICESQKLHYNTLEEGTKLSFKKALERSNIKSANSKFTYQKENLTELTARLDRKHQSKVVVIDSVQYFFRRKSIEDYFKFCELFENTTFIWISGADGNRPKGAIADDIYYDADIVVKIDNYEAIIEKNRFEAYEPRVIWQQGFDERQAKLLRKG